MAFVKFRHPSLYLNGKKMGTVHKTTDEIDSGDEPQFGDNGLLGFSDGAIQTKLTATAVVPVAGMEVDLKRAMVNKTDFDVAYGVLDGAVQQVTMRCLKAKFDADHKTGTLNGEFEFSGGSPNYQ